MSTQLLGGTAARPCGSGPSAGVSGCVPTLEAHTRGHMAGWLAGHTSNHCLGAETSGCVPSRKHGHTLASRGHFPVKETEAQKEGGLPRDTQPQRRGPGHSLTAGRHSTSRPPLHTTAAGNAASLALDCKPGKLRPSTLVGSVPSNRGGRQGRAGAGRDWQGGDPLRASSLPGPGLLSACSPPIIYRSEQSAA